MKHPKICGNNFQPWACESKLRRNFHLDRIAYNVAASSLEKVWAAVSDAVALVIFTTACCCTYIYDYLCWYMLHLASFLQVSRWERACGTYFPHLPSKLWMSWHCMTLSFCSDAAVYIFDLQGYPHWTPQLCRGQLCTSWNQLTKSRTDSSWQAECKSSILWDSSWSLCKWGKCFPWCSLG